MLARIGRTLADASLDARWAALMLSLLAFVLYYPAMNRLFAEDQLWYLAELHGQHSLVAGLRHYDYAATRQYWKGDDLLFRPLLFVWLAVANATFSYHHVWWNIANLAIHSLVAWSLFRLLMEVHPSPFALLGAGLFLVLKPPMELVLWNHLGGYMLACLFFTIGARAFVQLARDDPKSASATATYALAFTAAGLSYEAMVPVSLAGAAILLWFDVRARRSSLSKACALVFPSIAFIFLYAFHVFRVEHLTVIDGRDAHGTFTIDYMFALVRTGLRMAGTWTAELSLPSALTLWSAPFGRFNRIFSVSLDDPMQSLNLAIVVAGVVLLARSVTATRLRRMSPLVILLLVAIGAYVCIIAVGRAPNEVVAITYYTYIFALLLTTLLYALVDLDRLSVWSRVAGCILLLAFASLHAAGTASTARDVARANHYPALYLTRVIEFVDAHKHEPDFTFRIEPHPESLDPFVDLAVGYASDPRTRRRRIRFTEILFAPYYTEQHSKYVLSSSAEGLLQP